MPRPVAKGRAVWCSGSDRGSLARCFQCEDARFEAGETSGHGVAMDPIAFTDARFDPADAPVQADGEHGADDAGNGNDHRRQHEDRDQALQDPNSLLRALP
jgi:hypothetical protein